MAPSMRAVTVFCYILLCIPSIACGGAVFPPLVDVAFLNLNSTGGATYAADSDAQSGGSLAGVGDVNGDRLDDIIVAQPGLGGPGSAFIVFGVLGGRHSTTKYDMWQLAAAGAAVKIVGEQDGDGIGMVVGGAGDFNGDGLNDILIGQQNANGTGRAFLIFGCNNTAMWPTSLTLLNGTNGVMIQGNAQDDKFGASVAPAGDFNGDGYDDFVVGAPNVEVWKAGVKNGGVYIFFGHSGAWQTPFPVTHLNGVNGFFFAQTEQGSRNGGTSVAAGDFNNDGYDDVVMGSTYGSSPCRCETVYIVFGSNRSDWTQLFLYNDINGYNGAVVRFYYSTNSAYHGTIVSNAGDFNGDNITDLAIGMADAAYNGITGRTVILFGRPNPWWNGNMAFNEGEITSWYGTQYGVEFYGEDSRSQSGWSVAGGDFNRDGFGDIIIGACDSSAPPAPGKAHVVFGSQGGWFNYTGPVSLATLDGTNGFKVSKIDNEPVLAGDRLGSASSSADVNGDNITDIVIGAEGGGGGTGLVYVIYGLKYAAPRLIGRIPDVQFEAARSAVPMIYFCGVFEDDDDDLVNLTWTLKLDSGGPVPSWIHIVDVCYIAIDNPNTGPHNLSVVITATDSTAKSAATSFRVIVTLNCFALGVSWCNIVPNCSFCHPSGSPYCTQRLGCSHCSEYLLPSECTSSPLPCVWCGSSCANAGQCPTCREINTNYNSQCTSSNSNCSWCGTTYWAGGCYNESSECPECHDIAGSSECRYSPKGCQWCGSVCRASNSTCPLCSNFTQDALCSDSYEGCTWCGYTCVNTTQQCESCSEINTNEPNCRASTRSCTWCGRNCHDFDTCPQCSQGHMATECRLSPRLCNWCGTTCADNGTCPLCNDTTTQTAFQCVMSNRNCKWCGTYCDQLCPPCDTITDQHKCNATENCSWCGSSCIDERTEVCPSCDSYGGNEACCSTAVNGCQWCGYSCANDLSDCPACSNALTQQNCTILSTNCSWCGGACYLNGHCPSCDKIVAQHECTASLSNCSWCGTSCRAADTCPRCEALATRLDCWNSSAGCHWCGFECRPSLTPCAECSATFGQQNCTASSGNCVWCGSRCASSGACPPPCSHDEDCLVYSLPNCSWCGYRCAVSGKCPSCDSINASDSCGKSQSPNCSWCGYRCAASGMCPSCDSITAAESCGKSQSPNCSWCGYGCAALGKCPSCESINASDSCGKSLSPNCTWCGYRCAASGKCPSCDSINSSETCGISQSPHCTWCGVYCRASSSGCPQCADITDAGTCAQSTARHCQWCGSSCAASCPTCPNITTNANCTASTANCSWCGSFCRARQQCPSCSAITDAAMCADSTAGCRWCGFECRLMSAGCATCAATIGAQHCNASAMGCEWCGSRCSASGNCAECGAIAGDTECRLSLRHCDWCGTSCASRGQCAGCDTITVPDDCATSTSNCSWCGPYCRNATQCPPCAEIADSAECADSVLRGCNWCGTKCAQVACAACDAITDAGECSASTANCSWCGASCAHKDDCAQCDSLQTESDCLNSTRGCGWCGSACAASLEQCPNCTEFSSLQSGCIASHRNCSWCGDGCAANVSTCAACSGLRSSSACTTSDRNCSWCTATAVCIDVVTACAGLNAGTGANLAAIVGGAVGGGAGALLLLGAVTAASVVGWKRRRSRARMHDDQAVEMSRLSTAVAPRTAAAAKYAAREDILPAKPPAADEAARRAQQSGVSSSNALPPVGAAADASVAVAAVVAPASRAAVVIPAAAAAGPQQEPKHVEMASAPGVVLHAEFVPMAGKEFKDFQRSFPQYFQMHHEDYTEKRIKAGKKPLIFVVDKAWHVHNAALESFFEQRRLYMRDALCRSDDDLEERVAFHGTRVENIEKICRSGLLRVGHPLNPSKSTDPGFFGDPRCGVYASRFVEYTLQYSNPQVVDTDGTTMPVPITEGDVVRIVMAKCLPGRSFHMKELAGSVQPTPGYDSHSSPSYSEWFFFDETQVCPTHVVEVRAVTNLRTGANDGIS